MKTRTKQSAPRHGFIAVDHPPMHVLSGDDSLSEIDVRGAYLKVTPVLRSSEKSKFDAGALRKRLMAMGATAVVITPSVVPDAPTVPVDSQAEPVAVVSPEKHLQVWFSAVKGSTPDVVAAAFDVAMKTLSEAGL